MDEKKGKKKKLSIAEAVDNLSSLAELDVAMPISDKPVAEEEVGGLHWLDPIHLLKNREEVKESFRTIHTYLEHIFEEEKGRLKDPETQKGIRAIMMLAGEAAGKVSHYTNVFKEVYPEGEKLPEYEELRSYFDEKLSRRVGELLEEEEAWQKELAAWKEDEIDIQRRGLKDLEMVRHDRDYDLFFLKKENGHPFFSRNLLRHLKLVTDFDETLLRHEEEDPLLQLRYIADRDLSFAAAEMMKAAAPYLDSFFHEVGHPPEGDFATALTRCTMALMLAANPRNLIQQSGGKGAYLYMRDFHGFLRKAMSTEEYRDLIASPPDKANKLGEALLNLTHILCALIFTRPRQRKDELAYIQHLIKWGKKEKKGEKPPHAVESLWSELLDDDTELRFLLSHFPSGPMMKAIDTFREGNVIEGFDPIHQENLPSQLITASLDDLSVTLLHLPAPIQQEIIHRAQIVPEFLGFLRALKSLFQEQKLLLFNLQDRTSWREHARTSAVEGLSRQAEFTNVLTVVTLWKHTEFYQQTGPYLSGDEGPAFVQQLKEQVGSFEECGFFVPPQIERTALLKFATRAIDLLYETVFQSKERLSRRMRLDFIELFDLCLVTHLILEIQPEAVSFTCKDAVDVGAAASASFYGFLRLLSADKPWQPQEKELYQWLLYAPSLIVRERPIDPLRGSRSLSCLSTLSNALARDRNLVDNMTQELFGKKIKQLAIHELMPGMEGLLPKWLK